MEINLQNYVLGVFQVMPHTVRCVHGSNNKIRIKWDPGPTYVVQRLRDPGGPSYTSRSRVPTDLEKLGHAISYLEYPATIIIIPTIPSHPSAESSF